MSHVFGNGNNRRALGELELYYGLYSFKIDSAERIDCKVEDADVETVLKWIREFFLRHGLAKHMFEFSRNGFTALMIIQQLIPTPEKFDALLIADYINAQKSVDSNTAQVLQTIEEWKMVCQRYREAEKRNPSQRMTIHLQPMTDEQRE